MCYQTCKNKPQSQLLNHNQQQFKIIFPIHYARNPTPSSWKLMSILKAQQWGWVFTWSKCSQTARQVPPGGSKPFHSRLDQTQPLEYFSERRGTVLQLANVFFCTSVCHGTLRLFWAERDPSSCTRHGDMLQLHTTVLKHNSQVHWAAWTTKFWHPRPRWTGGRSKTSPFW